MRWSFSIASMGHPAFVIHVEALDWNCPQHITPRYTQEELAGTLEPMRKRMEALEAENARLRKLVGETATSKVT